MAGCHTFRSIMPLLPLIIHRQLSARDLRSVSAVPQKCHRAERFDGIAAVISLQFPIRQAADLTAKIRTLQFNQERHRTVYKPKHIRKLWNPLIGSLDRKLLQFLKCIILYAPFRRADPL